MLYTVGLCRCGLHSCMLGICRERDRREDMDPDPDPDTEPYSKPTGTGPEPAPPPAENIPTSVTIPATGPASSMSLLIRSPGSFIDGVFSRGDYSSLHLPGRNLTAHTATKPMPSRGSGPLLAAFGRHRKQTGHLHRQAVVSLMPRRRRPQWSESDARPFKLLPRGLVAAANVPVQGSWREIMACSPARSPMFRSGVDRRRRHTISAAGTLICVFGGIISPDITGEGGVEATC